VEPVYINLILDGKIKIKTKTAKVFTKIVTKNAKPNLPSPKKKCVPSPYEQSKINDTAY
jgi:hypothetical protein